MDIRIDFLRNPNQPLHMAARKDDTFCGLPRTGFQFIQTTPFRRWFDVLCPDCGNHLDSLT